MVNLTSMNNMVHNEIEELFMDLWPVFKDKLSIPNKCFLTQPRASIL